MRRLEPYRWRGDNAQRTPRVRFALAVVAALLALVLVPSEPVTYSNELLKCPPVTLAHDAGETMNSCSTNGGDLPKP